MFYPNPYFAGGLVVANRPSKFRVVREHPLSDGAVFLGFGEDAGGKNYKDSGDWKKPNDGTLTGFTDPGAAWGMANGRAAVKLDGAADYLTGGSLPAPLNALTVTGRIFGNPDYGIQAHGLIGRNTASSYDWILYQGGTGKFEFDVYNASNTVATSQFASANSFVGAWHTIGGVYDGTSIYCYLDKVAASGAALTGNARNSANTLTIGKYLTGYASIAVQDVLVWHRALSLGELAIVFGTDPMYQGWLQPIPSRFYSFGATVAPAGSVLLNPGLTGGFPYHLSGGRL